jgi:hypothetical protein
MSYGQAYAQNGVPFYAIGSGASFTPRAVARVGQAVIDHWGDHPYAALATPSGTSQRFALLGDSLLDVMDKAIPHFGFWGNDQGAWPSLPRDALVGLGSNDQVLLIVPSLNLVVVRTGQGLSGEPLGANTEERLEEALFGPLSHALR